MEKPQFIEVTFVRMNEQKFTRMLPVSAIAFLDHIKDNTTMLRVVLKAKYLQAATAGNGNNFSEAYISLDSIELMR